MQHKLISGDITSISPTAPPICGRRQRPSSGRMPRAASRSATTGSTGSSTTRTAACGTAVGPGFLPYTKGAFDHIDEMKEDGFEWDSFPGAKPRPTTRSCAWPTSTATA